MPPVLFIIHMKEAMCRCFSFNDLSINLAYAIENGGVICVERVYDRLSGIPTY